MHGLALAFGVPPGGYNPQGLANIWGWYRADLGITPATGVKTWGDQSGNGHDFSNNTGANQPTLNATGAPNSLPCLTGNGTSQFLTTASLGLTQPWELWMVAKWNSGTTGTLIDSLTTNHARVWQLSSNLIAASTDGGTNFLDKSAAGLTTWKRLNIQWNTTSGAGSWGGVALGQGGGTGVGVNNPGGFSIFAAGGGALDWLNGSIAEIIITSAIASSADRARVNGYLQSRYSIA